MSGFTADWLAARRPIDARSRLAPPEPFRTHLARHAQPLRIADLGAGTGANATFLQPHLGDGSNWRLVEQDKSLIQSADIPFSVKWLEADLFTQLEDILAHPTDLITGSALLDLVSEAWLERLADIGSARRAAFHFALSYDGLLNIRPAMAIPMAIPMAIDVEIATLFNRHQRRDKGFGPALGGAATAHLRAMLAERGYQTLTASTPWTLGPAETGFIRKVLPGIAAAAREQAPQEQHRIDDWLALRDAAAMHGQLSIIIGHLDLFAWLPDAA